MQVMTYTNARKNLKSVMDRVISDRESIVIKRKNSKAVVMMSLDEYNSINETLHLVQSPENARRLRASIAQLDADGRAERDPDL